ncbi:MAG: 23S rRNA pseudouridine(2604) synthase RluF [Anaerocolumna sp.]
MAKRTKRLLEHEEVQTTETEGVRLNKYLSDAGYCSRREADKLIESGEVLIDGEVAAVGSKVLPGQVVEVKGKAIKKDENLVLIAFHKPRGIVCTTDRREKDNIIDYLKYGKRIYPIGRLDKDSEGLILLTNDGDIVNKILRAGNNHEKEYIVTVNKALTSEFLNGMANGVPILDTVTKPCQIKALDKNKFQIILTQGMNRQIRRMCEYFDYKVVTLKRIRIMNVNLGHLQIGGYRNVSEKEITTINELIRDSENAPKTSDKNEIDMGNLKDSKSSQRQIEHKSFNKKVNRPVNKPVYKTGKKQTESKYSKDSNDKVDKYSNIKDSQSNDEKKYMDKTGYNRSSNAEKHSNRRGEVKTSDYRSNSAEKHSNRRGEGKTSDYRSNNAEKYSNRRGEVKTSDYRSNNAEKYSNRRGEVKTGDYRSNDAGKYSNRRGEVKTGDYRSNDAGKYSNRRGAVKTSDYRSNSAEKHSNRRGEVKANDYRSNDDRRNNDDRRSNDDKSYKDFSTNGRSAHGSKNYHKKNTRSKSNS